MKQNSPPAGATASSWCITMILSMLIIICNTLLVSSQSTDFLTTNSYETIQAMERHLFKPSVQDQMKRIFQSRIYYDGKLHTSKSFRYTFGGFWRNWKRMLVDGIPTGTNNPNILGSGGMGGKNKFVLFGGDEHERYFNITRDPRKTREPKRLIRIHGYEYGLANMATFLSQVMIDGIYDDACDESNEQEMYDRGNRPTGVFPMSNACGQYNSSYQDLVCTANEKYMECPQMPTSKTIEASFAVGKRSMKCGPEDVYPVSRNQKNDLGRNEVVGCCWWGRGPLHTKGPCAMGKINYFMGAKAYAEGRITPGAQGMYTDIDFCATPEAVCSNNDEDLMWSVAMFEWSERIQQYSSQDGSWVYKDQLVKFVNEGMNIFEYYSNDADIDKSNAFIHAVSSIVDKGCHNSPHCAPFGGEVNKLSQRRVAFLVALSALNIPHMRTELVVEQVLDHIKSKKDPVETNLLRYKTKDGVFPSQRYLFDDFVDAMYRFSRPYDASNTSYPANVTYFYSPDHDPIYMGDPFMKGGHKYGLANIALFLSNGLELSIEKDETCDELNEHAVSGKLPLSNSCGQRGLSYQDMDCPDDPNMACPLNKFMYITAVTASRDLGQPPPMQCGPRYRIPLTGFWDFDEMQESNEQSYANVNARVDVEGCCWWGRGILQTKGRCEIGRQNYYLGKRAAEEGRESLFPGLDFCDNPEATCGSQYKHELIWMSGFFTWVDRVQTYDRGGFNYIEKLHEFADGGMKDDVFIKHVGAIVQAGCHDPPCENAGCLNFPCDGAYPVDENAGVTKAFRTFFELNLWAEFPATPGGTNTPTPAPTQCQENCTEIPTMSPLAPSPVPTDEPIYIHSTAPSEAPTREIDARNTLFRDMQQYLRLRREPIESQIFVSEAGDGQVKSKLYTLDGFLNSLSTLSTRGVEDMIFYIGQDGNFDLGLVNIALFLAHAMTRGIKWDTCEEVNHHLVDGLLPISNACGQHGSLYSADLCLLENAEMECVVDTSMTIRQTSVGNSQSPPFYCGPTSTYPFTGYYDPILDQTISNAPFANAGGQVNVEGCCFWGRGLLLNQGVCNIGRFNHIFGLPAFMDGRSSGRYTIDFCAHPEALCSDFTIPATEFNRFPTTVDTSEVRYLIALFYWVHHVQDYNWGYWNYREKLKLFVDGGMREDDAFVDQFSDIVLDSSRDGAERRANFNLVLDILFMKIYTASPTQKPTKMPTNKPTRWQQGLDPPSPLVPGTPSFQTSVDGAAGPGNDGAIPTAQGGPAVGSPGSPLSPGSANPGDGSISNPNLEGGISGSGQSEAIPAPNPGPTRPVSIDLSMPTDFLPSNNVVDLTKNEAKIPYSGIMVLTFAIALCLPHVSHILIT